MTTYVAFLRGINVGGNNTISMKELAALCTALGFADVRTYINSGNVLLGSSLSESTIKTKIEKALHDVKKKDITVAVRTLAELKASLKKNPFPKATASQVGVLLMNTKVSAAVVKDIVVGTEEVKISGREVYIHYPDGMGRSKLKLPRELKAGTMRNINTLTKVAALAGN